MTVATRLEIRRGARIGGGNGPYYEYDLRLRSRPAQHIARRYLRVVAHAAHVIGIMMSEADGEADDDGAGEWVDAIIAEAAQEMMAMLAPWRALAQQHAIGIAEGQEPPMTMTVEVSTPLTNIRYAGTRGGSIYGFNQPPRDNMVWRMGHRGPLDGLYFVGAWTQPGGGFEPAMMSGQMAGGAILHKIRKAQEKDK